MQTPIIIQQQDANNNMSPEAAARKAELKHLWDFEVSASSLPIPPHL